MSSRRTVYRRITDAVNSILSYNSEVGHIFSYGKDM